MNQKKVIDIIKPREKHWVGDGFYVSTLFSPYQIDYKYITPFILMDHAAPKYFAPTEHKHGVGEHPHRGFETVTFAIKGEVAHRDSSGGGGIITTGGVQWMSAASGVVHEEFHSKEFAKRGGEFEMVQLWVNLPAKDKMSKPRYQSMDEEDFNKTKLSEYTIAKIISGELLGVKGKAQTYTDINIYEIKSSSLDEFSINLKEGSNTLILQLSGESELNNSKLNSGELLVFDRAGEEIHFKVHKEAHFLILNGEPIDEPIKAHGPFVMNTEKEIIQAIQDYNNGKMGQLIEEA